MNEPTTRTCYLDLPGFKHDVFISYTHLDNEPDLPGEEGWIDIFHYSLEQRLRKLLGCKEVGVWRDHEGIRGNEKFADKLVEVLSSVGVLVSVISPSYVGSEWCLEELRRFLESAARSGHAEQRVFPVLKEAVEIEKRPTEIKERTGYEFLRDARPITLRSQEEKVEFAERIETLARDIKTFLESFRTAEGAEAPTPHRPLGTVYLAEPTPDLVEARDRIRRALLDRNYRVLPDSDDPLPTTAEGFERVVRSFLQECDLSIHMIGADYGARPEGERRCIARLQIDLAQGLEHSTEILETPTIEQLKTHVFEDRLGSDRARNSSSPVKHIIWLPRGIDPKDERQATFVGRLRNGVALQRRPEAAKASNGAGGEESSSARSEAVTEAPGPTQANATPNVEGKPRSVYLICDQQDVDEKEFLELSDLLFDLGLEIELPAFVQAGNGEMSDEDRRKEQERVSDIHRDKVARCDAFLVYYGTATDSWFESNFGELKKLPGLGRDGAVRAIFLGLPASDKKNAFKTREALVFRTLDEVKTLVDALQPTNGGADAR